MSAAFCHTLHATAIGYAFTRNAIVTVVAADPIVKAMAVAPDTDKARIEWAEYLYSRYCGNGSVPMPSSLQP